MNRFAKRLDAWMTLREMNDRQLAEALGFDPSYIWNMRNGKRPVTDAFRWRFAERYGFPATAELFDKGTAG